MKQASENPEKLLAREVGSQIASRRKAKKLTQAQLAEQMEIEKETVSRLETDNISPTLTRLAQLAHLLDCDKSDFLRSGTPALNDQVLSLINRMENPNQNHQDMLIALFARFAIAIGKLSAKDRKAVENSLKELT